MDSPIYSDLETSGLIDDYPKTSIMVEVIERRNDDDLIIWESTQKSITWMYNLLDGDTVLIEYPIIFVHRQSGYGKDYVHLTNTRTGKTISLKTGKLGYVFWYNIKKFRIIQ